MSSSERQEWGRLTIRLVKSLGQIVDTNELQRDSRVGRLTARLVKSLGQGVDKNELQRDSRVGKINSKTSKDTNVLE